MKEHSRIFSFEYIPVLHKKEYHSIYVEIG